MEELLAAGEDKKGSWGARAWEAYDVAGLQETVKRVGSDGEKELPPPPPYASPQTELGEKDQVWDTIVPRRDGSGSSSGSGGYAGSAQKIRASTTGSSVRMRTKDSRRMVTAVFRPTVAEEGVQAVEIVGQAQDVLSKDATPKAAKSDEAEDARIAALEAEVIESRALLAALRVRVEIVEGRLAAMAVDERQRAIIKANPIKIDETSQSTGARKAKEDESEAAQAHEPYALGDLPGYVVLVGLGVCAIVLRVVMQRVALGRRA